MGFGTYSSEFSFVPRSVPAKPPSPPRNLPAQTDKTVIYVEYDELVDGDDGGSAITSHTLYIDDGNDGEFTGYSHGADQFTWDTSALTLETGLIYRLKYSATNVHGEGPLSDEVMILLAVAPDSPSSLTRVDMASLAAGEIRVTWSLPADEGGDPVKGYLIYLNDVLFLDQSTKSTLNQYTFTGLNVGQLYKIGVSAVNDIGEGVQAEITELAASVPAKPSVPTLVSSTEDSIAIEAPELSFNGGDAVTEYVFRRDDGPATAFQEQETSVQN